jgi:hypothetical protein
VQGAAAKEQARTTPERENMRVQGPHSDAPDRAELAMNGKSCATDENCSGRLRCMAYTDVGGREMRQCLFSCLDSCPDGWVCQAQTADGPRNACQQEQRPR